MRRSSVSVGIVTKNRPKDLRRCLTSLTKQTLSPKEVIIVDSSNTGSTKRIAFLFKRLLPIVYIRERQLGIGLARNRAIQKARGSILAFIDDDCEATEIWIEEMVRAHKKYPKAIAIQGQCHIYPKDSVVSKVDQEFYNQWVQKNLRSNNQLLIHNAENSSFKIPLLRKLGISYEDMYFSKKYYYCEDVDFGYQLLRKGQTIVYAPKARIFSWRWEHTLSFFKQRFLQGVAWKHLSHKWALYQRGTLQTGHSSGVNRDSNAFFPVERSLGKMSESLEPLVRLLYTSLFNLGTKFARWQIRRGDVLIKQVRKSEKASEFSVAIVTRNRERLLARCLRSLVRQTKFPLEVVVVDNASSDKTKSVVTSFRDLLPIRYIFEPNIGIPYARNRALKVAKGKILAFIDDDCEATPEWVEEIGRAHRLNPKAAAIQGKLVVVPIHSAFGRITQLAYDLYFAWNRTKTNELLILDTSNVSFKRRVLQRNKLRFDINFPKGCDADFGKQLLHKYLPIILYEKAKVYYEVRTNIFSYFYHLYRIGKTHAALERKWSGVSLPQLTPEEARKLMREDPFAHVSQVPFHTFMLVWLLYLLDTRIKGLGKWVEKRSLQTLVPVNVRAKTNISVAVATRNRAKLLEKCLSSLVAQTAWPKEVLIIHTPTNDATKTVVERLRNALPLRYIVEKEQGVAVARNRALREARGAILAYLDDDCEATPEWVEEIQKAHKANPTAVAIQGESLSDASSPFGAISQSSKSGWITFNLTDDKTLRILDVQNASLKIDMIRKLGITFDPTLNERFYYGEDLDFSGRLFTKKQQIVYVPSVRVYFTPRATLWGFLKQRFLIGRSNIYLFRKWPYLRSPASAGFVSSGWQRLSLTARPFHFLWRTAYRLGRLTESMLLFSDTTPLTGRFWWERVSAVGPQRKQHLSLSVMIITKDRYKSLRRCLRSLVRQTRKPDEIIIVDSSTHPQTVFLRAFRKYAKITYIYENRLGFGIARNTAMSHTSEDIVATIDDDGEAPRHWCERIIAAHLRFPKAVAVQGRIVSQPQNLLHALVEQLRIDRWFLNSMDGNCIRTISTKNVSFKRKLFKSYCLCFQQNPLFGKFGGEDIDMGYQIVAKGQHIIYEPSIMVHHWERSTLGEYLKQQYRKGCSSALVSHWPTGEGKRSNSQILQYIKPIFELLVHSRTQRHLWLFPFILPIYYLSLGFYQRGRQYGSHSHILKPIHINKKTSSQSAPSLSVAIVTRNRYDFVQRALLSLTEQSILPTEVIVVDNGSKDRTREVVEQFKAYLPVLYLHERKIGIPYARNRALQHARGRLLAFLDDDCEATETWVESMLEGAQKYPFAWAIQGLSVSMPKEHPVSIVAQFNRQTWIRDSILGDRSLYWDWVGGKLASDFEVLFCDTRNLLLKLDQIGRMRMKFDETMERGSDSEFGKQIFSNGGRIILYPKALVYHYERDSLKEFLTQRMHQGRTHSILTSQWPPEYFLQRRRSSLHRFGAFINFCIANNQYVSLPLLALIYVLSQKMFRSGEISVEKQMQRLQLGLMG